MRVKNSFFGSLITGIIFSIIGYFIAFNFGTPIIDNAKSSVSWPTTQGIIQESRVENHIRNKKKVYNSYVKYTYSVDNKNYTSSTVYFGDNHHSTNSNGAYKIVKRYPKGTKVTVSYDPKIHQKSVLEPGAKANSYMVFAIGLIFLGFGLMLLVNFISKILFGIGVIGYLFASKK